MHRSDNSVVVKLSRGSHSDTYPVVMENTYTGCRDYDCLIDDAGLAQTRDHPACLVGRCGHHKLGTVVGIFFGARGSVRIGAIIGSMVPVSIVGREHKCRLQQKKS